MATAASDKPDGLKLTLGERTLALVGFGIPFNEVLGQPREFLVADLPYRLTATMKGGRIAVQVR